MTLPPGRLAIGIATRGRPLILSETLSELLTQTRQPDAVIVTYADRSDIGDAAQDFPHVRFLPSLPGLTTQRNIILQALGHYDFITFLDDDFWPHSHYLASIMDVLLEHPEIAVATGQVLADGINGTGLDHIHARAVLQAAPPNEGPVTYHPVFNAYGCNMTLRLSLIRRHGLRFDEQLPLYGWYEDVDFSRQLSAFGAVVHVDQAFGVHLGVKSGRQSGVRLGYSQVANPVYLARKGSVHWPYAVASMTSRTLKNLVYSVRPEPHVDRRGRLKGNAQGWLDLCRGGLDPKRILAL